ncbi:MAG: complex I subunit 5 family protein [Alcanivorax sp.]|nr:complex I subunit 5 family protein [Alcanivorax sp.]
MSANWLLLLAPLTPLLLAGLWCLQGYRDSTATPERRSAPPPAALPWLAALAPVPALLIALFGSPGTHLILEPVLLGNLWVLDDVSRALLGMTALLWLISGLYAQHYRATRSDTQPNTSQHNTAFWLCWLLALAGNLGLILCRDIAGFYSCFALMTFAGYGLVVHSGSAAAKRAGRIYLIMAVPGEMLILSGLVLAASVAASPVLHALPPAIADHPWGSGIAALLWAGFGIKAGLAFLHMWLPLAHPVAPTPASAVLSGAMIKAGLLGWILVLPLGLAPVPWATLAMTGALIAAIGGALIGVTQRAPKTVLAYSSISQMGIITSMLATGLMQPALWPALAPVVVLYAVHHGLAKGALFLGVSGLTGRARLWLWLPALSLAGLPLTTGAAAKVAMKEVLYDASYPGLILLLSLAAVGTTLLMVRFMYCLRQTQQAADNTATPDSGSRALAVLTGLAILVSLIGLPWLTAGTVADTFTQRWPGAADAVQLLWPVAAGLVLGGLVGGGLASRFAGRFTARGLAIPAGDLIVLAEKAAAGVATLWQRRPGRTWRWETLVQTEGRWLARIGQRIAQLDRRISGQAGGLFVVLAIAIMLLASAA